LVVAGASPWGAGGDSSRNMGVFACGAADSCDRGASGGGLGAASSAAGGGGFFGGPPAPKVFFWPNMFPVYHFARTGTNTFVKDMDAERGAQPPRRRLAARLGGG
jgi:hypothetical protein